MRNKPLSDEELTDLLNNKELFKDLPDRFKNEIWQIKNNDYSAYDIELTIKPTLLEAVKYIKIYEEILVNLENFPDSEGYCGFICGKVSKINNISYKKKSSELSMGNVDEILNLIKQDQHDMFLSTGYPALDRLLVGGIPKEDTFLFLLMAPSGLGKSLFMLNLANKMKKVNKCNVLILSLEMSVATYTKRYITLNTGIALPDLQKKQQVVERIYKAEAKSFGDKVRIIEYPTSQATVVDFENKILELKSQGWTPDVVIVDYLTIMKPLNKVSSNKGYESGITLAEELRGLSGKLKIPFISAIQSNRNENANTSKVDVSNVSESYGIVSTCDYLGALYQSEEDRMDGRIYFKTLKNRNGSSQTLLYSVNYENLNIEELSK